MKKRYVRPAVVAVALLSLASLAACQSQAGGGSVAKGSPIIIGAPLALTGVAAPVGLDIEQGAQLAVADLNKAGGVGGHKVDLQVQDTAGVAAQAVQVATSFAHNQNVVALLGPVSAAEVGALTGIAASNKIVLYTPSSAGAVPGVNGEDFNAWTFRVNESIPLVVGPQMTAVLKATGATKVTVLSLSDQAAYVDTGDRWQKAAEAAGATVQRLQFPSTTEDYSSIVTNINPDAQVIAIGAESGNDASLTRAIKQAGLKGQLMGDASFISSEVYTGSRGATDGAYAYSSYLPGANKATNTFQTEFVAKFTKQPDAIAAYSYDATKLMFSSIKSGNVTREAIRKALSSTKNYAGVSGQISYDGSGDAQRTSVPLVQIGAKGALKQVGKIVPLGTK
jgi:branched-chain amino acid transport system substrate-binding protein